MIRPRLLIPAALLAEAVEHARGELPAESCGLFAGRIDNGVARVTHRHPLVNELNDPVRFRSEPRSMFAAHKAMRAAGTELLAVYHSHPAGEPVPSGIDLAESYAPSVACVIIGLSGAEAKVRAWWLEETGPVVADWEAEG